MVDVASITVAVISLAASVGVAIASGILTIYTDERKAQRETDRLLRRYRDPLLLAAQDLQSRLYNIINLSILSFLHGSQDEQDCLVVYTAFLFGQYLCWTHILRQQAQFACFTTDEHTRTQRLARVLVDIQKCINTDSRGAAESPFCLGKGHQLAIGELMTVVKPDAAGNPEMLCMGFAEFTRKWKAGQPGEDNPDENGHWRSDERFFRYWFDGIERSIHELDVRQQYGDPSGFNRIRRLQHLLLDLIDTLDPQGARVGASESKPVSAAPECVCSGCVTVGPRKKASA